MNFIFIADELADSGDGNLGRGGKKTTGRARPVKVKAPKLPKLPTRKGGGIFRLPPALLPPSLSQPPGLVDPGEAPPPPAAERVAFQPWTKSDTLLSITSTIAKAFGRNPVEQYLPGGSAVPSAPVGGAPDDGRGSASFTVDSSRGIFANLNLTPTKIAVGIGIGALALVALSGGKGGRRQ
jgi:hypothetical protein